MSGDISLKINQFAALIGSDLETLFYFRIERSASDPGDTCTVFSGEMLAQRSPNAAGSSDDDVHSSPTEGDGSDSWEIGGP